MAAVNVTSGNSDNNRFKQGARTIVRNSSGIPYVIVENVTDAAIDVWKGNSTTPTSFSQVDSANRPTASVYGSCSAAIDSSDVIHIMYGYYNGKTSEIRYVTIASDAYAGNAQVIADIGDDPTAITNIHTSIAIDSNNIPHAAYIEHARNGGTSYTTVSYNNRIGGAWNASSVEVEGATATKQCLYPDIAVDADNKPVICYINTTDSDVGTAIGNANDASSFTLNDVDTDASQTSGERITSIVVDSSGNHYVAYEAHTDGFIYVIKHNYGDAWTTWQTRSTGSDGGINPSLVANGADLYVFYEDPASNDIYYEKITSGSTWGGDSVLETGTYNTTKAKWGFWVDNDSGGALVTNSGVYYFDGSDAAPTDSSGVWTDDTNADDGDTGTYAYTASGNANTPPTNNYLVIEGTNYSGVGTISSVEARIFWSSNFTPSGSWGSWTTVATPTGGWSSSVVQALQARLYWDTFDEQISAYIYTDAEAQALTNIPGGGGPGVTQARIHALQIRVNGVAVRTSASELDYAFADETATPDILWNTLSLGGSPPATATPNWPVFSHRGFRSPRFA